MFLIYIIAKWISLTFFLFSNLLSQYSDIIWQNLPSYEISPLSTTSITSRQQSTMAPDAPSHHRHASSHHKRTKPSEKHPKFGHLPLSTSGPLECALTGIALLNTPYLNKGAGFPADERTKFGLTGLLPANVSTLDQQVKRAYDHYSSRSDDLAKNTFMTSLADQNEVLYYRVSLPGLAIIWRFTCKHRIN